jgi:hypothetical protein
MSAADAHLEITHGLGINIVYRMVRRFNNVTIQRFSGSTCRKGECKKFDDFLLSLFSHWSCFLPERFGISRKGIAKRPNQKSPISN